MPTEFEDLLSRMPDIAKAIGAFGSEAIQMEAFRTLVNSYLSQNGSEGQIAKPPRRATPALQRVEPGDVGGAGHSPLSGRRASARSKQTHSLIKSLDFVKGARKSFDAFVDETRPHSLAEKCLVSVYWLERLASVGPVTSDHVYTAFKHVGWEIPADLVNTLQQAGTKGWLDSKKRDDLKVVVAGENFIEHRMLGRPKQ